MIEAVNSVISNAPFTRSDANKVDASAVQDPSLEPVSAVDVNANNILATFDTEYGTSVTQILNPQSGQVLLQFPSENSLETREAEQNVSTAEVNTASSTNIEAPQSSLITTFDVFDSNQQPSSENVNTQAQSEAAANALNEAAQSGIAALSVVSVTA